MRSWRGPWGNRSPRQVAEVTVDIMRMRIVKRGPLLSAKQSTEASEAP